MLGSHLLDLLASCLVSLSELRVELVGLVGELVEMSLALGLALGLVVLILLLEGGEVLLHGSLASGALLLLGEVGVLSSFLEGAVNFVHDVDGKVADDLHVKALESGVKRGLLLLHERDDGHVAVHQLCSGGLEQRHAVNGIGCVKRRASDGARVSAEQDAKRATEDAGNRTSGHAESGIVSGDGSRVTRVLDLDGVALTLDQRELGCHVVLASRLAAKLCKGLIGFALDVENGGYDILHNALLS